MKKELKNTRFIKASEEHNSPIDDIAEKMNLCRLDHYKLFEKDFKAASVRLRHNLDFIIKTARKMKKDALIHRKEIEERHRVAEEEARIENENKNIL